MNWENNIQVLTALLNELNCQIFLVRIFFLFLCFKKKRNTYSFCLWKRQMSTNRFPDENRRIYFPSNIFIQG